MTNLHLDEKIIHKLLQSFENAPQRMGELELSKILTKCNKQEPLNEDELKALGRHLEDLRRTVSAPKGRYRWLYQEACRRLNCFPTPPVMWVITMIPRGDDPDPDWCADYMWGPCLTYADAKLRAQTYVPEVKIRPVRQPGEASLIRCLTVKAVTTENESEIVTALSAFSEQEEKEVMRKLLHGEPLGEPLGTVTSGRFITHIHLMTAQVELISADMGHWCHLWFSVSDEIEFLEKNQPAHAEQEEWDVFNPLYVAEVDMGGDLELIGPFSTRVEVNSYVARLGELVKKIYVIHSR